MKPNPAAIKALREAKGVSLRMLENRTGLDRSYLSRLERGKRGATPETVELIAQALDVEVAALTYDEKGDDTMTSPPTAVGPALSPDVAALVAAVAEVVAAKVTESLAAVLEANSQIGGQLPPELRVYTAEQLATAWDMKASWFEQRAYNRSGPATKVGHFLRWSHADVLELLRAGQIGPRGKDLPRAA